MAGYVDQVYRSSSFGAGTVRTKWWQELADGRLQCDVCPRRCRLRDGQRGLCFVRARDADAIVMTSYGRSSGYCVDPIEKKPLYHFLPGSAVLSFGTAGCNLTCKYCQNWDISKSRDTDTLASAASPATIAEAATKLECRSVAFTYNDPTVFLEYAVDTAAECRARGISTVAVTAGYIEPGPRAELLGCVDAANVDLKSFDESFYHRLCGGHLAPVLETLRWLVHESDTWTEVTTLVIPGHNDSEPELRRLAEWVGSELSPDVPLHFSAFHPDWKMTDVPPTPWQTLRRARQIALEVGLRYVYTGNVTDTDGGTTSCPECGRGVIERDWYELLKYDLDDSGHCRGCGTRISGVFAGPPGHWGRRRLPVDLARFAPGST